MLMVLLATSCRTNQKILYFQDVENQEAFTTRLIKYVTIQPGDKLSIIISSATTPELAARYNMMGQNSMGTNTSNMELTAYTVDPNGDIDVPSLGRLHVRGLTRTEVSNKIQHMLHEGVINDATVTVNTYNQYITILGEAGKVGRIPIKSDNLTIIEAIGEAGDLTIDGLRNNILVMRPEGGKMMPYYVDIRSKDIMESPVYNLQQNDIIYIKPNKKKTGTSEVNGNVLKSYSTYFGFISFGISLITMIRSFKN